MSVPVKPAQSPQFSIGVAISSSTEKGTLSSYLPVVRFYFKIGDCRVTQNDFSSFSAFKDFISRTSSAAFNALKAVANFVYTQTKSFAKATYGFGASVTQRVANCFQQFYSGNTTSRQYYTWDDFSSPAHVYNRTSNQDGQSVTT